MIHDLSTPDPLCHGDDPCVCEQLHAARLDELEHVAKWIRTHFPHPTLGVQKILRRVEEGP